MTGKLASEVPEGERQGAVVEEEAAVVVQVPNQDPNMLEGVLGSYCVSGHR